MGLSYNDVFGIIKVCKGLSLNDSYQIVDEEYKLKDFDKFNVKNLDEVINGEFQIALINLEENGVRY